MKEYLDVVHYQDRGEGKKAFRMRVGYAFVDEKGRTRGRIDMQPTKWDGDFVIEKRIERDASPTAKSSKDDLPF